MGYGIGGLVLGGKLVKCVETGLWNSSRLVVG